MNAMPCNHIFNCPRIDLQNCLTDKSQRDRDREEKTKKCGMKGNNGEADESSDFYTPTETDALIWIILNTGPLIKPHALRVHRIGQNQQE